MDLLELQTLADELAEDATIATRACTLAARRLEERSPAAYDSSAHNLARCYNVIEQMALRVAKAFENAVDDEKGWHTELIRRLSIRISGVRPALFPEELRQPLHELKAFRHVFVHAYDLELDPEKLALVLKYGRKRHEGPPSTCHTFRVRGGQRAGPEQPRLRADQQ